MVDFDLVWTVGGAGEGEGEPDALLNGCARHRGPFCAGTLMVEDAECDVNTRNWGN